MKLSLLFILGLIMMACSSDEPEIIDDPQPKWDDPLEGIADKGDIRFDSPEIGQRSRYVFFNASKDINTKEVTLNYTGDTLVLAIIAKESDKWVIREFLTPGSENLTGIEGEETVRYLSVDADSAYFTAAASPFTFSWIFLHQSRTIPLKPFTDPALLNQDCLPVFAYSSDIWMQYSANYTQLDQTFIHLNNYFDYTDMSGDGHGFMYAYGPAYGLVRWSWVSYWDLDKAEGWDLLPHSEPN